LEIRAAREADADDLAALAAAAFWETYKSVADPTTVQAVIDQACTPEAFRRLIRSQPAGGPECLLVAADAGQLAAFLDFGNEPEGLELRRLYTAVGGTGRGVGTQLLEHLERSLPAGTRYRIVVLAANERGLSFWLRHGFERVGEVNGIDHFTSHRGVAFAEGARPEPFIVMAKTVGSGR
jgi:ribosomal protein S18 acetylase RimI-like enzyme